VSTEDRSKKEIIAHLRLSQTQLVLETQRAEKAEAELAEARKDTERLDWCIIHGAAPLKASDGTWDTFASDESPTGHGENARAAIDAVRDREEPK
jgi:hypothetical protein